MLTGADHPKKIWTRLIGETIGGRYRVMQPLGAGGMGELYEVEHIAMGRRLALKVLRSDRASSAVRFEREARAAGVLESIHIVPTIDVGQTDDGMPYFVMELLKGEDLGRTLRRGLPPICRAAEIVRQAAIGVAAAHGHGIVHRDLKPANIFLGTGLDGSLLVKVLDFGIAKLDPAIHESVEHTNTGTVLGTAPYMSLEQARGSALDLRSDVYSLGVVLYEALSGRRPFEGGSYNAILYRILTETPEPMSALRTEVPIGLGEVVARAMARDVEQRFPTAQALAAALAPFAEQGARTALAPATLRAIEGSLSEPTVTLSASLDPRPVHRTGRRIGRVSAMVAVAAVVVTLGTTAVIGLRSRPTPVPAGNIDTVVATAAPSDLPVVRAVAAGDANHPAGSDGVVTRAVSARTDSRAKKEAGTERRTVMRPRRPGRSTAAAAATTSPLAPIPPGAPQSPTDEFVREDPYAR